MFRIILLQAYYTVHITFRNIGIPAPTMAPAREDPPVSVTVIFDTIMVHNLLLKVLHVHALSYQVKPYHPAAL